MSDTKFYRIGAAVLFSLVALILIFMIAGKKSKNKQAKTEDNPAIVSSLNVIENSDENNNLKNIEGLSELNSLNEIAVAKESEEKENEISYNKTEETKKNRSQSDDEDDEYEEDDDYVETNTKVEEILDPVFKYPVEGEISVEYAKDKLVFSNTLNEWVIHPGIDIKANKTDLVKASSAGTVRAIKNDPRYGLTVVIEHANGFSTVYANLLTAEFVSVGENVTGGQTIGTVGNVAAFEIMDEPHLHFEILKDGEQIDPSMYLKN